jgi:peptidyl-prolyl cis-trans isomerase SurA
MNRTTLFSRRLLAVAVSACAMIAVPMLGAAPTAAQQVVARVNGEPITAVDVAQRTRLLQVSGGKNASRQAVIDELIDELLKLQTANRYKIEISDSEVNQVVANMASRMRASPEQFAKVLAGAGISINALKRKLRADIAWNNIVRGKFHASLQIREKDVFMAVRGKGQEEETSYNYTLRPILLVVPRGAGAGALQARRREAEGLRARFQNCEDGLRLARGLSDVAIREPMTRTSADLPGKLREVLDRMAVGRLTPPDVTPAGIEVFALCAKTASKIGNSGAERDVKEKMFSERFEAQARQYLKQLRRRAAIEIR